MIYEKKLKKGNLLIANEKANERFRITKCGWTGKIINISDKHFLLKSIKDNLTFWIDKYDLIYFDLYKEVNKDNKSNIFNTFNV